MSVLRVFTRNMATAAKINNVVVIGGGLMGSGIAQVSHLFVICAIRPDNDSDDLCSRVQRSATSMFIFARVPAARCRLGVSFN